jgi:ATP adenylyltransferase
MDYIRALEKPEGDKCFFCTASAAQGPEQMRQSLVLWSTPRSFVLMNRYPYTNGHLLVAPRRHEADLDLLDAETRCDLMQQTVRAIELLKRAISPQGFNIGINLGRCAGAGVPGHVHQHVVPRWGGDTNFMSVVGEVRVVPEALSQLYDELMAVLGKM